MRLKFLSTVTEGGRCLSDSGLQWPQVRRVDREVGVK